jgi:hypothetical protein
MNGLLTICSLLLCGLIVAVVPTLVIPYTSTYGVVTIFDTGRAILLTVALGLIASIIIYRRKEHGRFLLRIFLSALLIRMLLATAIYVFQAQDFFGGDALTYDAFGWYQLQGWLGDKYSAQIADMFVGGRTASGWGMVYLVAAIYGIIGRNMLAIQLVNAVLGSATAVIIFLCAQHVFNNFRVASLAAIAVAFYPSLVLWSSQGLKDGPIVFFLALAILVTLKLGQRFTVRNVIVLLVSLVALLSLRFYVFYMICVAIGGAFVIGMQSITAASFVRQFVAILILGLGLTYLGVTRSANVQFETYGSLERVQQSRIDLARSAESGFGKDVDVSTTSGALSTIPLGLLYMLFAPFPWQVVSLRQSITLPEMVVWWASFPLLVLGFWYAIRYRLRMISPILIFTVMLTFAYSIFQGNVGTAYRQRAQLLVFYFIFVAVGFVLLQEKREERKRLQMSHREELAAQKAASVRVQALRSSK